MKAILVNPIDNSLNWSDVPDPVVGEEDVLVEIHYAALNRADLLQRAGDYPPPPGCPEWMGLEIAGYIREMGPVAREKSTFKCGDAVFALLGGGAVFLLIGLVDDRLTLSADIKLLLEIPVLLIPFVAGVLPRGGGALFAGLFLLLAVNAVNFIDGLDGLCTLVCAGSLLALSPLLLSRGLAALFLLFALLGFLPHNRHPARIFLGDTGALALGYAVGLSALFATDASPVFSPLFLFLPMLDLALTVIRRTKNRAPLLLADGGHIHHKLLARGTPYRTAVRDLSLLHLSVTLFTLFLYLVIG